MMDYNFMCKDPSFFGMCNYVANIYKLSKGIQDSGLNTPYYVPQKPTPIPRPYSNPDNLIKSCQPDRFTHLIGSIFDPKTNSFKLKDGATTTLEKEEVTQSYRIIGPNTMVTNDLRPYRLNIIYDNESKKSENEGTVTKIYCS